MESRKLGMKSMTPPGVPVPSSSSPRKDSITSVREATDQDGSYCPGMKVDFSEMDYSVNLRLTEKD